VYQNISTCGIATAKVCAIDQFYGVNFRGAETMLNAGGIPIHCCIVEFPDIVGNRRSVSGIVWNGGASVKAKVVSCKTLGGVVYCKAYTRLWMNQNISTCGIATTKVGAIDKFYGVDFRGAETMLNVGSISIHRCIVKFPDIVCNGGRIAGIVWNGAASAKAKIISRETLSGVVYRKANTRLGSDIKNDAIGSISTS
jgi:hypothetical protein